MGFTQRSSTIWKSLLIYSASAFLSFGFEQSALGETSEACRDLNAFSCSANRPWNDGTNSHAPKTLENNPEVLIDAVNASSVDFRAEARRLLSTSAAKKEEIAWRAWKLGNLNKRPATQGCFRGEKRQAVSSAVCQAAIEGAVADVLKADASQDYLPDSFAGLKVNEYDNLVHSAPMSEALRRISMQVESSAVPQSKRQVIADQFEALKASFESVIGRLEVDESSKSAMRKRLKNMKFNSKTCSDTQTRFGPNAFYDSKANEFTYCPFSLLYNDSLFSIIGVMAHEMGHGFDRCSIQAKNKIRSVKTNKFSDEAVQTLDQGHPFAKLTSCLRGAESIDAKICGLETLKCNLDSEEARNVCEMFRSTEPTFDSCGQKANSSKTDDQTTEAIADWFSAEVVADVIPKLKPELSREQWQAGLANMMLDGCASKEGQSGPTDNIAIAACDSHPESEDRLNSIYSSHPALRAKMGCGGVSPKKYCDIMTPSNERQTPVQGRSSTSTQQNRATSSSGSAR